MKLHLKGFLLVELSNVEDVWDNVIVTRALNAYGRSGRYWENSIRLALDELAAAGLICRVESKLDDNQNGMDLAFKYALTEFGRLRMRETGLLIEGGA